LPKIEEDIGLSLSLDKPEEYNVFLHNDDYTTMEFVVEVLMDIFHKTAYESEQLMIKIHRAGKAICGVYTYDIAQTKVYQVRAVGQGKMGFPLIGTFGKGVKLRL